jgi:hypothetical protein
LEEWLAFASQDKFPKSILPRRFDFGFTTGLMVKDLKLCLEEAEAAVLPMWIANSGRQLWQRAHQEIGPEKHFTAIVQMLERRRHKRAYALADSRSHVIPGHDPLVLNAIPPRTATWRASSPASMSTRARSES